MNNINNMNQIDRACLEVEKYLNVAGYVPFVGSITALGRHLLGTVQIIVGLATATFSALAAGYHKIRGNDAQAQNCLNLSFNALNYVGQGLLNNARAIIERFPLLPLLVTLPYDLSSYKILKYPSEPANYQRNIDFIHAAGASLRRTLGAT